MQSKFQIHRVARALLVATVIFTCRAGLALASSPEQHFVTTKDTVADSATLLTWQRVPDAATYTFEQAKQYCLQLDLDGKGWRVPSVTELLTLVDETRSMPAIDPKAFPKTAADYFWTSSTLSKSPSDARVVSFRFGFDAVLGQNTQQRVRCVR